MNDQLITFENAKLAKQKGFDGICNGFIEVYISGNPSKFQVCAKTSNTKLNKQQKEYSLNYKGLSNDRIAIPTQSLLQRWFREVHKINVESNYLPNIGKYRALYKPMIIKNSDYKTYGEYRKAVDKYYGKTDYNTYEDALEIGLQEAFKLL